MIGHPVLRQSAASDCGIVCLQSVLRWHGHHVSLRELRQQIRHGRDGVSAQALIDGAAHFGLSGRGVFAPPHLINSLPALTILHTRSSHFVLFLGPIGDGIRISDPIAGQVDVPADGIAATLSGVALVLERSPGFRGRSALSLVLDTWRAWSIRPLQLLTPSMLLAPAVGVAMVLMSISEAGTAAVVTTWTLVTFLALLGAAAAIVVVRERGVVAVQAALCTTVMSRLSSAQAQLLDDSPDVLLGRWREADPRRGSGSADFALPLLLMSAVVACLLSAFVDPGAGIALSVLLVALGALVAACASGQYRIAAAQQVQCEQVSELLRDVVDLRWMARSHPAFAKTARATKALDQLRRSRSNVSPLRHWLWTAGEYACYGAVVIAAFAVLPVVPLLSPTGESVLHFPLVACGLCLLAAWSRVALVGWFAWMDRLWLLDDAITSAGGRAARAGAESADEGWLTCGAETVSPVAGHGLLRVYGRRRSRGSPGGPYEYADHLLAEVVADDRVVLVGPNRAGKTSLARHLAGLAVSDSFDVRVEGARIVPETQTGLSVLLQDDRLRNDSLRGNLLFGLDPAQHDDAFRIAEQVGLTERVSAFPMGFDTPVIADGAQLARSDRQLILLVRTLARPATLLVLDEPLAHLDAPTRARVIAVLGTVSGAVLILSTGGEPFPPDRFRIVALTDDLHQ